MQSQCYFCGKEACQLETLDKLITVPQPIEAHTYLVNIEQEEILDNLLRTFGSAKLMMLLRGKHGWNSGTNSKLILAAMPLNIASFIAKIGGVRLQPSCPGTYQGLPNEKQLLILEYGGKAFRAEAFKKKTLELVDNFDL